MKNNMAEEKGGDSKKGGFYRIKGGKVDVSDISPDRLKEIADETGADFPVEADSKTGKAITRPELIVVVSEKK